ncbi:MAG TPA: hypothetical protein VKT53_16065, partial [Candidatus Acidoferrum sp.]|nr:hypothetical protein [Candidatus Acidoferrum sp.]
MRQVYGGFLARAIAIATLSLFALVGVGAARAQVAPAATNGLPGTQGGPPLGDLTALSGDAKVWLQDLIKINTTNPPGNEAEAAKYILEVLK